MSDVAASASDAHDPAAHPVYTSLVRPVLTLGVERHVAGLEATLCLAIVFGVGLNAVSLGLLAVVVLVLHPTMVWVTAWEPLATELYVRSRAYADYYAPHAALHQRSPRPRPSLPGRR
jgi:type IV secretory pathway TrbD component